MKEICRKLDSGTGKKFHTLMFEIEEIGERLLVCRIPVCLDGYDAWLAIAKAVPGTMAWE